MHASLLLHSWLGSLLSCIHVKRLIALFDVIAATVSGPALSVTSVGRRLTGTTTLKHKIKRADRLIGNTHLYSERKPIYSALCRVTLACIASPMILIDWSDLKADQSLHLLRASVPVGGHSLTLYEEVHPQKLLGNRVRQHRFLQTLVTFLPPGVEPIIVADSGFRVPFFREVERLGWRWVGRVRGREYVRLGRTWINYKSLFMKATTKARCLGFGSWVKSDPFAVILVLVRLPKHGRTDKTASGRKARSKQSRKAAQNQREPWLLVASPRFANISAKKW